MPKAEKKKTVGIKETTYEEALEYARSKDMFIGEVFELAFRMWRFWVNKGKDASPKTNT